MTGDRLKRYSSFAKGGALRRAKFLHGAPVTHETAYFAEQDRLEHCLEHLQDKPLKLIAPDLWTHARFQEIPWENAEWSDTTEGGRILKQVLLNRRDLFQFSIANAVSKQDWHYHRHVFEIYLSSHPMSLAFRTPGVEKNTSLLKVTKGIFIVPPGLPHKVSLSGTTFVFQATLAGGGLGKDKILFEE